MENVPLAVAAGGSGARAFATAVAVLTASAAVISVLASFLVALMALECVSLESVVQELEAVWDTAMCYKHAQLCVGIEIVMPVVYQRLLRLHRRRKACLELP